MSPLELREKIGGSWIEHPDGWWLTLPMEKVRDASRSMLEGGARLASLVGLPKGEGELLLTWHWDLEGVLLSVRAPLAAGQAAPSIADLCPAADWAEREARDYFAIRFEGRADTPPLMLRPGDEPGFLLPREGGDR